jgi:TonB dependent receptor
MVSKNGTNQYHGELFEFIRNQHLDASNYFDVPVAANNFQRIPLFIRNNFGAAGGGPIKKDKTFFYAAYEGLRVRTGGTVIDTVPAAGCHGPGGGNSGVVTSTACPQLGTGAPSVTIAPVMSKILSLYPVPDLPNNQFTYPVVTPTQVDWGQIRVDQNFSSSDTIFGRYTVDKSYFVTSGTNATTIAGSGFPQFLSGFESTDTFATLSWNHIFSPTLLNQARFAYTRANSYEYNVWPVNSYAPQGQAGVIGPGYSFVPGLHVGSISISGYSTMGPNNNDPQGEIDNRHAYTDDLFLNRGKQAFKFGVSVIKFNSHTIICGTCAGSATFTTLGNFLQGIAASYTAIQPNADYIRNWMYWVPGFYAQDDWKVARRVTLNMGVRYEWETIPWDVDGHNQYLANLTDATFTKGPIFAPLPKTNISPRLGFAWDVWGNGKTAIRGGFGSYYDVAGMLIWLQSTKSEPPYNANNTHVGNSVITIPFTFLPTDVQGISSAYHNYKNARLLKWNATIDQELPWRTGLSVSYVGTRGIHMWQYEEGNPTTPSGFVSGFPYWNGTESRINPHFNSNSMGTSNSWETYDGMQVGVFKNVSQGLQFQASYTWSHNIDTIYAGSGVDCVQAPGMSQGLYFGTPGYTADGYDKGPACQDVRNVFHVNAIYHLPSFNSNSMLTHITGGWWLSGIWSAQGGYPFTPILGTNRSQSQDFKTLADRVNLATSTDVSFCQANSCPYQPVAYNKSTVIQHKPTQWFNPNMFDMAPMEVSPGGAVCTAATCGTTKYGTLGNAQRGLLRGPGLQDVDFAVNKDTKLRWLGESGNLQFRAEAFNILNHPNFGMPNATVISGTTTAFGADSQAPSSSAGLISSTVNTSRQLQFALKVIF